MRTVALTVGAVVSAGSVPAAVVARLAAPHAYLGDLPLCVQLPLVGLFFATGAFLLGLLTRTDDTWTGRARAWLDGAGVGLAVIYVLWLLVFSTAGVRGAAMTATLVTATALAAAVAGGLHATHDRVRMRWYATGSALCVAGLAAVILTFDYHGQPMLVAVGALAVAGGTAVVGYGQRRPDPGGPPASEPGYPLLLLPLVAAALATGYHLMQKHSLDPTSITLGIAGLGLAAGRETLGALTLRRYAAHLAAEDERLRALVLGPDDVALVLDGHLVVRWQSVTAARLFGLSDQEVVGRPVTDLLHADDVALFTGAVDRGRTDAFEVRLRDGFGAYRVIECGLTGPDPVRPSRSWVVHVRDVSKRRDLERTLHAAAYTDRLTTLANQGGLRRAADPPPRSGALMVFELTGLVGVRDRYGEEVADAVLVEAARRLRTETDPADLPARLDGTRFAVLTRVGAIQAHLLASRLLTALAAPYPTPGAVAHVSGRAGLADLEPGTDLDEVVRRAELAVRAATTGAAEWYEPDVEARVRRRATIEQELRGAVARGELDLVFQPVVELATGHPVGIEALLRWRHPELGSVRPPELVPAAEELGLLDELGEWVLHRACRHLAGWRRARPDLWLAVNVSAGQLAGQRFLGAVPAVLESHGIPAEGLVVEVAEPGLVAVRDDPYGRSRFTDLVDHLGQLRTLGVRTAIDNFGTGPTSLSQLRVLPLDLLKLDRSVFDPPSPTATRAAPIVDVLVRLSAQLGLDVVAQRLESEDDLDTARRAGCRYAQGHLLSPPLLAEHLEAYLEDRRLRA